MKLTEVLDKAKDENGIVTVDSINKVIEENKAKFVDLSEDGYVSKNKYTTDLKAKADEIDTLNTNLASRDSDLEKLKTQLSEAGTDAEKLKTLETDLTSLQGKYDEDVKNYQAQLSKQAYEFAVKEFAGTKNFTSQAARRDFVQSMIAKNLPMENEKILGAEDFVTAYTTDNADAFVVEEAPKAPEPAKPQFVQATPGAPVTKPTSLSDMMKMANDNPGMSLNF